MYQFKSGRLNGEIKARSGAGKNLPIAMRLHVALCRLYEHMPGIHVGKVIAV